MNGTNPAENIVIKPEDTITVPKAELIYVIGSVKDPAATCLAKTKPYRRLQVLSLAEGLDKTAAGAKARVMRTVPGNPNRTEIPINLKEANGRQDPGFSAQVERHPVRAKQRREDRLGSDGGSGDIRRHRARNLRQTINFL